jgi:hypothetical protein
MRRKHEGQAVVEMLVVGPLILAVAAGVMALALYMQAQTVAVNTARHAVWERSVWADPDEPWNGSHDGELGGAASTVMRPDYDIAIAGLAYTTNPNLRMRSDRDMAAVATHDPTDPSATEVMRWGGKMRSGAATMGGNVAAFIRDADADPDRSAWEILTSRFSHSTERDAQDTGFPVIPSHMMQDFGIDPLISRGLGFDTDSVLSSRIALTMPNVFNAPWAMAWLDFDGGPTAMAEIQLDATASLLANPWAPKNEDVFQTKVHGLDVKPLTNVATYVSAQIGEGLASRQASQMSIMEWLPIFGDIQLAGSPSLQSFTEVLPYTRVHPDSGTAEIFDLPADADPGALGP